MGFVETTLSIAKMVQKAGHAELCGQLLEVSQQAIEIQEENRKLREENIELKRRLKVREEVVFRDGVYFSVDEKGALKRGPFCPKCWEDEEKLISLISVESSTGSLSNWLKCPKCDLRIKEKLPPGIVRVTRR